MLLPMLSGRDLFTGMWRSWSAWGVEPVEVRVLTVDEARRLVSLIRGDRFEALWLCALTLGLRKGELLGLRSADIDFSAGARSRYVGPTANGRAFSSGAAQDRAFSPDGAGARQATLAALRTRRLRQDQGTGLAAGATWVESGLVFATRSGTAVEPRNISRSWYAIRERAGLGSERLHDLRHSCASFLLAAGASPRTVMKTLGHSQIGLTMNTYTHVLPDIERTAVDAAAQTIFGPAGSA